jgi:hypothetical protein
MRHRDNPAKQLEHVFAALRRDFFAMQQSAELVQGRLYCASFQRINSQLG